MVFNKRSKDKKAQAAIEFLMTYGWMLLVVLIVGALIFSFVDFGSLLPARLELNNGLIASAQDSVALATDAATNADQILVAFTYNQAKQGNINASGSTITSELGEVCIASGLLNVDSGAETTDTDADGTFDNALDDPEVSFVSGQEGVITFDCSYNSAAAGGSNPGKVLNDGDTFEGEIKVVIAGRKPGLPNTVSTGAVRLPITSN